MWGSALSAPSTSRASSGFWNASAAVLLAAMIWPMVDSSRTAARRKVSSSYARNVLQVSSSTRPLVSSMIVISFRRIGALRSGIA
jgi:hypothetical protein